MQISKLLTAQDLNWLMTVQGRTKVKEVIDYLGTTDLIIVKNQSGGISIKNHCGNIEKIIKE